MGRMGEQPFVILLTDTPAVRAEQEKLLAGKHLRRTPARSNAPLADATLISPILVHAKQERRNSRPRRWLALDKILYETEVLAGLDEFARLINAADREHYVLVARR
jgi:hypothetical protein